MRRQKYKELRNAGFSSSDATKYKDLSDENVQKLIDDYTINLGDTVTIKPSINEFSNDNVTGIVISKDKETYAVKVLFSGTEQYILLFKRNELIKV